VGSHPLTDSTYLRVTCVLHDFLRRSGRRRTIRDRWRLGKDWDAPVSIRPMQVHHAADVERRPAREERDRSCAPHPRWMTLLARGAFTVLELGVLAYLVHLVRVGDGARGRGEWVWCRDWGSCTSSRGLAALLGAFLVWNRNRV